MSRGGKRKGAGLPRGYKFPQTLEKDAARELTRQIITRSLQPMIKAQIANAIGIGHLYTRDKSGKFTKIEEQAKVDELLSRGTEGTDYWIFIKDPSVQAFTDLLNRAIDKPKEQVQEIKIVTVDERIARLERARTRLPEAQNV